jgi:hypothetical protein
MGEMEHPAHTGAGAATAQFARALMQQGPDGSSSLAAACQGGSLQAHAPCCSSVRH